MYYPKSKKIKYPFFTILSFALLAVSITFLANISSARDSSPEQIPATSFTFQTKLVAADGTTDSFLGQFVGISGNTAIAYAQNGVYVFVRSGTTWMQQAFLVPSDGISVVGIPQPVVISGDTIVIGGQNATINSNTQQGAVYVFTRFGSTWNQQRLTASDGAADDSFGASVAISGDTIAIGARRDDIGENANQGSAYIFTRNGENWTEQAKLTASDGAANNVFGNKLALSGDTLVVGAPQAAIGGNNNQGAAYVFVRNGATWSQQAKIFASDGTASPPNFLFSNDSITIGGDVIFVGHFRATVGGLTRRGKVYVFARSGTTWTEQPPITANDGLQDDNFGRAVAIEGNTLVVGAYALNSRPGSAYIFTSQNGVWTQEQKLQISGATTSNIFGDSVSISENTVLVGVSRDTVNGNTNQGSAYVYTSAVPRPTQFDFDGDGKADQAVFRPSDSVWYQLRSNSGFNAAQFGISTDKIAPADFDGDGKTDIAVFRDGIWYWLNSSDGNFNAVQFGIAGDIPVTADYTGDGRAELAVYRGGNWYTLNLANNQFQAVQFGIASDKTVQADFDGDGKTDFSVYRNGVWYMLRSTAGFAAVQFGIASDLPVVGDYDGDGKADQAVYRSGVWYVLGSAQGFYAIQFGIASDFPAAADYDGDGKTDIAVYRDGIWYLLQSTNGFASVQFGIAGDKPIPAAYMP